MPLLYNAYTLTVYREKLKEKELLLSQLRNQLSEGVSLSQSSVCVQYDLVVQQSSMERHQIKLQYYQQLCNFVDKFFQRNM